MSSLKSRLNIGVFIISLIFFSSLIIINVVFFNSFGEDFVQTRLQHDTDALLANLRPDADGKLRLNEDTLNPIFLQPFSGHYFRVEMEHETYLSRSLWDKTMSVSELNVGETAIFQNEGPTEQTLLTLEGGYSKEGQTVLIAVSEDYTPITDSLQSLTIALVFLNGGIIIFLMLLQRIIVNRGMAPLRTTTEELSLIGSGEKSFLNEAVPEEVLPLVKEINKLMVMVDNRIKRSTTALGNLAHALKTPLALIEQSVTGIDEVKTSQEIIGAADQIKHQLNSELKRARIIGSSVHGQKIDLADLMDPLISTLKKIYRDKDLSFELDIDPDATYIGDRHDMMELFGNLLDNACKNAVRKVSIKIKTQQGLNFIIEDDGPGIKEDLIAQIEKRGTRLDEAGDGHGLGLSIVREIIDLNNARIKYSRSDQFGGLKVFIEMPDK
ncbi:MAG: sensor histidine kinase [Kordiimonadaceae bacterium]|jgi:signal transduction histidine kinase|nr:sensor histidine kinase [Kordiimonadaceae bacterium]MBT6037503.1 sensor histidine kinase [Kordiimonadaceae bacterium]MBT6328143.1 sensor histidine kinase [Kordiimonadaceae bacterium]